MSRFFSIVKWLLLVLIALYAAVHVYFFFAQRSLQYSVAGTTKTPIELGVSNIEIVQIQTGNGKQLLGWYGAPKPGKPTLIYYRGNTGSFTLEHKRFAQFIADGYGLLSFDYRGFPGSEGDLGQDNILQDGLAAFDWVASRDQNIVLWGRSLGSGVATYVASKREAQALVLESPYTATVDVAKARYPFLLVDILMLDKFPSREWIKDVVEPVFIGHGTDDQVIGVENGRRLFDLTPNGETLWIKQGGTHSSLWDDGIWAQVQPFFEKYSAQ
ncbi:alpha/beta hydrolase [Maritalea sp.]|uniref:alpha/beta hydrolase n=1 Tax=Maritalea sp. TaxID=2003361 RepID=UPI003EF8CAEA